MANGQTQPGIGVDSKGGAVIDPTSNVLSLVSAAVERIDDLRKAESLRVDDLRKAETRRVDGQSMLRAEYEEKLREAEAKRIDAIRAVDVNAVAVASERAAAQASVLATQVSASAETLRSLVATSAQATATQLQQIITPITDRLALLEKAQYTGAGKEGVTDPLMSKLLIEMEATRTAMAQGTGRSSGFNSSWGYVLGAAGLVMAMFGIISFFR